MPRRARMGAGGIVFHVLNRASRRHPLFSEDRDYEAFVHLLGQASRRASVRILAYCVMPNHWHLVVWPRTDGELSSFMHWLTMTHAVRWHSCRRTAGLGPVYQGRFKAVPVQDDMHLLRVCRYVERNAVRAGLVQRAEDWHWGSLWQRVENCHPVPLSAWPIPYPPEWPRLVNDPLPPAELHEIRLSTNAGSPIGEPVWRTVTAAALSLPAVPRRRGRPPGEKKGTGAISLSPPRK